MKSLDLPALSTSCFSRSCSHVSTDKLEDSGGMCCRGHAASSEKFCFLPGLGPGGCVRDGATGEVTV